jgi:hypothetical protein
MNLLRLWFIATVSLLLIVSLASAEPDPPGRVARLQYITGSVSVQPHGVDDWVEGSINRPLTTSDNVWVAKDSRLELNLGTALVRANSESSLTLTNVSDNMIQLQLNQGTLSLKITHLYKGEVYEIDTPNLAFTVQKAGEYRFDVGPDNDATDVTVWKGEGDATGDGPAVHLRAHDRATFTGGTSLTHEVAEAPAFDGFDDWCRVRDRRVADSLSARYVAPGVIGYEDLDTYGYWRELPTYGPVWVPTVATGWAPYHYGHWVWVAPWGWTWVDDAAWGFAPFHYGRWIYTSGYWAWVPGPAYVRPVYAPALVAWFGGPALSVAVGFGGGYGWCPLGYGEPYIPWYAGSRQYFQTVNVTNTHITNITYVTQNYYNWGHQPMRAHPLQYANFKAPNGVTAVPERTVTGSFPVAKTAIPVRERDVRAFGNAPLGGKLALTPTRESGLGVGAVKPVAAPPQTTWSRPVVTRMQSPVSAKPGDEVANLGRVAPPQKTVDQPGPISQPTTGRFIPRPPQASDGQPVGMHNSPRPTTPGFTSTPSTPAVGRSVPRPPEVAGGVDQPQSPRHIEMNGGEPSTPTEGPTFSGSPIHRDVPSPPEGMSTPSTTVSEQPRMERNPAPPMSSTPRSSEPAAPPVSSRPDPGPRYSAPSAPPVNRTYEAPHVSAPAPVRTAPPVSAPAPVRSAPPASAPSSSGSSGRTGGSAPQFGGSPRLR